MQKTTLKHLLSFAVCIVLVTAIALFTIGCKDNNKDSTKNAAEIEVSVLGEGSTVFTFTVIDEEGVESFFEIHTDKDIVGDALQELDLIEGEDAEYGLYVKTVNNITVDYSKDGKYWAFYENGEYAAKGVDMTEVVQGTTYSFKVE